MGRVELENRSLGQIIEEPIRITKGFGFKSLLFYVIPHNPEGSGERFQGHHGPTPGPSWTSCLTHSHTMTTFDAPGKRAF